MDGLTMNLDMYQLARDRHGKYPSCTQAQSMNRILESSPYVYRT